MTDFWREFKDDNPIHQKALMLMQMLTDAASDQLPVNAFDRWEQYAVARDQELHNLRGAAIKLSTMVIELEGRMQHVEERVVGTTE